MIRPLTKTFLIFGRTFYYYIISHRKNADINYLKQKWAANILNEFNIDLEIKNQSAPDKKIIFVGNHISFLDIIVLIAAEPRIVFLSKAEVARWPIIGHGAKRVGTIFVKRDSSNSRAASKAVITDKITSATEPICIAGFPSGTTQLRENLTWKKGLFDIAQATNTPIQSFKINYHPLRECAYIEDDSLLSTMHRLFKIKNKKVTLEWGNKHEITDAVQQSEEIRKWTHTKI